MISLLRDLIKPFKTKVNVLYTKLQLLPQAEQSSCPIAEE